MLTDSIRQEFDISPDFIFLNSGSSSIAPRSVCEEIRRLQDEAELNPTAALINCWRDMWNAQSKLADFLGARPTDIFLRNNISEAMNNFILGLPLGGNDEIIYSDLEYGAIKNICRFRAEKDGLPLREFPAPRVAENAAEKILAAIGPKTRMLVLSHIFTSNGLVLPIETIAEETRRREIYFVVDGAHAAGALPLDFTCLRNIDCYGGNIHKWLMGPKGSAFGWVHPMHQERILPLQAGWTTFDYLPEHKKFGEGSRFQGRFAAIGTMDFSSYLAIPAILTFWNRFGAQEIRSRINMLQNRLKKNLTTPALEFISPEPGAARGPLLSWKLPENFSRLGAGLMSDLMTKEKLQIALPFFDGGRSLRLSPHIYNTVDEIDRAAAILQRYFY